MRCSTVRWQRADPRDIRTAMLPDLPVPGRFADGISGTDAALEAALARDAEAPIVQEIAATRPVSHWTRSSQGRRR